MSSTPMTLQFLGASGTVTGSKYLLAIGDRRVLVDAGLFQGEKGWRERNWDEFPMNPADLSDVVLTHAHADHSTYLPVLVRNGYGGPIWMTRVPRWTGRPLPGPCDGRWISPSRSSSASTAGEFPADRCDPRCSPPRSSASS